MFDESLIPTMPITNGAAPAQAATVAAVASPATAHDENLRTVTLEEPIVRPSGQRIDTVLIRKPMGGALRRVTLGDLLSLNTDALQAVLPRVTEPQLVKQDFELMDPADLVKLGSELISFFVPKKERS